MKKIFHKIFELKPQSYAIFAIISALSFLVSARTAGVIWGIISLIFLLCALYFVFKKPFWGIVTIVLVLPFSAFLTTYLRHLFGLDYGQFLVISAWKEILLSAILFRIIYNWVSQKNLSFKINLLDKAIFIFTAFAAGLAVFKTGINAQAVWGMRYLVEMYLFYFAARSIEWDKKKLFFLLKLILISGAITAILGILQSFVLPKDFLTNFGYSLPENYKDITSPLAAYHLVDPEFSNMIRSQSTLSGPIQLGSYMLLLSVIALAMGFSEKDKKMSIYLFALFSLFSFVLFTTFTRSVLLGLFVALAVMFSMRVKRKLIFALITGLLVIISGFYAIKNIENSKTLQTFFLHNIKVNNELITGSTEGHITGYKEGVDFVLKNPLGVGVGKAGPATFREGETVVNESWYLQVAVETGVLGLIIFLFIIGLLIRESVKKYFSAKDNLERTVCFGILGSVIGISVAAFFLHTWADTVTVFIFWILAGILFSQKGEEGESRVSA